MAIKAKPGRLMETQDFLRQYADEYRVWWKNKKGGGSGWRYSTFSAAEKCYQEECAKGIWSEVYLEASLRLKEYRKESPADERL